MVAGICKNPHTYPEGVDGREGPSLGLGLEANYLRNEFESKYAFSGVRGLFSVFIAVLKHFGDGLQQESQHKSLYGDVELLYSGYHLR